MKKHPNKEIRAAIEAALTGEIDWHAHLYFSNAKQVSYEYLRFYHHPGRC